MDHAVRWLTVSFLTHASVSDIIWSQGLCSTEFLHLAIKCSVLWLAITQFFFIFFLNTIATLIKMNRNITGKKETKMNVHQHENISL